MRYRFTGHTLDLARRELHRDGTPVVVEPKVFDLLVYLLENRERVVGRDELIEHVWRGRIVSDGAVDTAVKLARQAVGDSGAAQRAIRTVPRKGVRFVADPIVEGGTDAPRAAPADRLALPDKPSIAVLPFANLGGDPEEEYFADGMTEDLITALSKFRWMFVIARNSAFVYKGRHVDVIQTGRELGVRHVLEGSVRKAGTRIRLTAQLIDATTGGHVWADRYDRDLVDVFAVQDELTAAVAGALAPALERSESERARLGGAADVRAWDHCLRGMWHFHRYTKEDARQALLCFGQAQTLDPALSDAHAWAARVRLFAVAEPGGADTAAPLREAFAAGHRALNLDRENALAHYVLALGASYSGDFAAARQHADRAVELNPNLAIAHAARALAAFRERRHEEGLAALDVAARLSPNDSQMFIWDTNRASALYCLGRYEAAAESARRGASIRWFSKGALILAASLAKLGQAEAAGVAMREILAREAKGEAVFQAFAHVTSREDRRHLLEGLRAAGMPEEQARKWA